LCHPAATIGAAAQLIGGSANILCHRKIIARMGGWMRNVPY
jgi:hypothetical protein